MVKGLAFGMNRIGNEDKFDPETKKWITGEVFDAARTSMILAAAYDKKV